MVFYCLIILVVEHTAGIGRMGPPRKIDLFWIADYVVFTIITDKMYIILVDYDGYAVS